MREFTRQEANALDRYLTTDPRDQWEDEEDTIQTNTQDKLDDLTLTIGDSLRETWLHGYNTASSEILTTAISELEQRLEGWEQNEGDPGAMAGLSIGIAILKGLLK